MNNEYKDNYRLEYLTSISIGIQKHYGIPLNGAKTGFKIMTNFGTSDVLQLSGLESSGDANYLKTMGELIMVKLMSEANDSATVNLVAHMNTVAEESLQTSMSKVAEYVQATNSIFKSLYALKTSDVVKYLPKLSEALDLPLTDNFTLSVHLKTEIDGYTSFGVINTGYESVGQLPSLDSLKKAIVKATEMYIHITDEQDIRTVSDITDVYSTVEGGGITVKVGTLLQEQGSLDLLPGIIDRCKGA